MQQTISWLLVGVSFLVGVSHGVYIYFFKSSANLDIVKYKDSLLIWLFSILLGLIFLIINISIRYTFEFIGSPMITHSLIEVISLDQTWGFRGGILSFYFLIFFGVGGLIAFFSNVLILKIIFRVKNWRIKNM